MPPEMPRPRAPHLEKLKTRHGKTIWYFRVGKGPRTPLPADYGSPAFQKAYSDALHRYAEGLDTSAPRTLGWLIDEYLDSPQWKTLGRETRKQFKYQFARMKQKGGKTPLRVITPGQVVQNRDDRADKPTDANKFVKASRKLYAFAVERGWMRTNPAKEVATVALPNRRTGFHTWTEEEVSAFEARWPIGARERLALDLLLYTGVRRSDVVRLGRQHVKNGEIVIKTEKSVNMGYPVEITVTVLPPLAKSIEATATGDLAFLVTAKGTPFGKESFGTWFKKACKAAGVPGSSHGLRKIAAVRSAENGATEIELNAMFGWSDGSKESAAYVRKANRAKLSRKSSVKMLPAATPQTFPQTITRIRGK